MKRKIYVALMLILHGMDVNVAEGAADSSCSLSPAQAQCSSFRTPLIPVVLIPQTGEQLGSLPQGVGQYLQLPCGTFAQTLDAPPLVLSLCSTAGTAGSLNLLPLRVVQCPPLLQNTSDFTAASGTPTVTSKAFHVRKTAGFPGISVKSRVESFKEQYKTVNTMFKSLQPKSILVTLRTISETMYNSLISDGDAFKLGESCKFLMSDLSYDCRFSIFVKHLGVLQYLRNMSDVSGVKKIMEIIHEYDCQKIEKVTEIEEKLQAVCRQEDIDHIVQVLREDEREDSSFSSILQERMISSLRETLDMCTRIRWFCGLGYYGQRIYLKNCVTMVQELPLLESIRSDPACCGKLQHIVELTGKSLLHRVSIFVCHLGILPCIYNMIDDIVVKKIIEKIYLFDSKQLDIQKVDCIKRDFVKNMEDIERVDPALIKKLIYIVTEDEDTLSPGVFLRLKKQLENFRHGFGPSTKAQTSMKYPSVVTDETEIEESSSETRTAYEESATVSGETRGGSESVTTGMPPMRKARISIDAPTDDEITVAEKLLELQQGWREDK